MLNTALKERKQVDDESDTEFTETNVTVAYSHDRAYDIDEKNAVSTSDAKVIHELEWRNVNVSIETKEGLPGRKKYHKKQILTDVNGWLDKSKLLGILGASGAGKSTLLNALCGRLIVKTGQDVTGQLVYNGAKREIGKSDCIKNISGYVMQSDVLPTSETVHDALLFSAALRLDKDIPMSEKEKKVDTIMDKLQLNGCKDRIIGNEAIKGLSCGEKKRISVGLELVTDANLIFLGMY